MALTSIARLPRQSRLIKRFDFDPFVLIFSPTYPFLILTEEDKPTTEFSTAKTPVVSVKEGKILKG